MRATSKRKEADATVATIAPRAKEVAVVLDMSSSWGRRMVRGILNFAREHGPWALCLDTIGPTDRLRPPVDWRGDGVICRVPSAAAANAMQRLGVPVVNVSGIRLRQDRFPRVTGDGVISSQLAARFLLDRGFRNFGYYAARWTSSVSDSFTAFEQAVESAGCACDALRPRSKSLVARRRAVAQWAKRLPKPAAVFTWAQDGIDVLEACRAADILVPHEIAVLGGDDDDLRCEACTPPLSAIATPTERVGYEAAAVLHRMMNGEPAPEPIRIPPTNVVERQSTESLAIDDADIRDAVQFIQANATQAIQIDDVLRRVPISRRALEYRFERVVGRTPAAYIRRLRMEAVKRLLVNTNLPISEVAQKSGFGSAEYLSAAFRQAEGVAPLEYRLQFQGRRAAVAGHRAASGSRDPRGAKQS